jgi:hypothetical protein
MAEEIIVPELSVRVMTGPTCYPHEKGFSSISAEAVTGDQDSIVTLRGAMREQRTVIIRCAMLDVTGKIAKETASGEHRKFAVQIDGLVYRKPEAKPVIVEHLRKRFSSPTLQGRKP